MPAVIMNETSHHHCVSNSATSRNKYALHILGHQICKYSWAGKKCLHIYIPQVSSDPIHFLQKNNQKTGIILYIYLFFVILFIINRLRNTKKVDV